MRTATGCGWGAPPPQAAAAVLFATLLVFAALSADAARSIGDRLDVNFFAMEGMPLTQAAAEAVGWSRVGGPAATCDELYGVRYRRAPRLTPTIMYDALGQVAGMQFSFNTSAGYPLYPGSSVISPPYFPPRGSGADVAGVWTTTMHFSDPAGICTAAGRAVLPGDSVGDRLWARVGEAGNDPTQFYALPLTRDAINPQDGWVAGGCLPSKTLAGLTDNGMGQHYWRNFHSRMALADGFPWFLLFDQHDQLTMFGLSVGGPLSVWPTTTGDMDTTWSSEKVAVAGPNLFEYPRASTAELWTYPGQPLIPFFHLHSYMPEELLFLNLDNASLPCGTFSTSTLHVVLRDSSNITAGACKGYNASDPLNSVQSAEAVRASYAQAPPEAVAAAVPAGIWSLAQQCNEEVARAAAAAAASETTASPATTVPTPTPTPTPQTTAAPAAPPAGGAEASAVAVATLVTCLVTLLAVVAGAVAAHCHGGGGSGSGSGGGGRGSSSSSSSNNNNKPAGLLEMQGSDRLLVRSGGAPVAEL